MRWRFVLPVAAAAVLLAGCSPAGSSATPSATGPTASRAATPAATTAPNPTARTTAPATHKSTPATKPTGGKVLTSQVLYGWATPTAKVSRPGGDLPAKLVSATPGNHAGETPAYARVSFHFSGGRPAYNFNYAAQVLGEGQGNPLPLKGNVFLRFQFTHLTQEVVSVRPSSSVGFTNLKSYACSSWSEGSVTCGMGLQVAGARPLPVRVTLVVRDPDDTGTHLDYIIAVDFRVL